MEVLSNLVAMQNSNSGNAAGAVGGLIFFVFMFAILIVMIAAMWKVFAKAGQPGWAAIIPIFNLYILLKITGRPVWWMILFFIPLVSLIVSIITMVDLAKSFGKGVGFAIGLLLLGIVFFPILGFGDAEYQGPVAS